MMRFDLSDAVMYIITTLLAFVIHFTPLQVKFVIIGVVAPFLALYMNHKDYGGKNAKFSDYVTTFVLSIVFVWFGYELSNILDVSKVVTLIGSFFLSIFSLSITFQIRKHIPEIIKSLSNKLIKWMQGK